MSPPLLTICITNYCILSGIIIIKYNFFILPLLAGLVLALLTFIKFEVVFLFAITDVAFFNLAVIFLGGVDIRPYQIVWCLIFAYVFISALRQENFSIGNRKIILPLILYVLAYILSIINSLHKAASIRESLQIIYFVFIFLTIQWTIKSKKLVEKIINIILIVTLVAIGWGWYMVITGKSPINQLIIGRKKTLLINKEAREQTTVVGGYRIKRVSFCYFQDVRSAWYLCQILILILAIAMENHIDKQKKICLYLLFWLGLIVLIRTYSRAGLVIFFLSTIFLLYIKKKLSLGVILVLGIFGGSMLLFKPVAGRLLELTDPMKESSIRSHLRLYTTALIFFKHSPLFGVGAGMCRQAVYSPKIVRMFNLPAEGVPHNIFLEVAGETGIIGLLSVLWLLWVVFRSLWQAIKLEPQGYYKDILIGLFVGLVSSILMNQTLNSFNIDSFWILFGLSYAASTIELNNEKSKNEGFLTMDKHCEKAKSY